MASAAADGYDTLQILEDTKVQELHAQGWERKFLPPRAFRFWGFYKTHSNS